MNILFDLDGTLIDSKIRLYNLFQFLVPESNLSFEKYWELKKNKINHQAILLDMFNYTNEKWHNFNGEWMKEIESDKWLEMDKPFDGVTDYLRNLSKSHSVYLVTNRQNNKQVLKQIQNFGWENLFEKILVTQQKEEKYHLIKRSVPITEFDYMIGDTGMDIQTGKLLGCKTIAVLSGFLGEEALKSYSPDFIVDTVINCNF